MKAANLGAHLLSPNQVRFRLWAPDCDVVAVRLNGRENVAMQLGEDGIFEALASCGEGTRYKYQITPDLAVPDPASRGQSGDVHDDSLVIDPHYAWRHEDWKGRPWHETVVYELHPGAIGGFAGISEQLERLAKLGVTAVELMPIADFPGRHNWGYDGVLPYAPDAAYGTPDELKALIDRAHGLGLQVFLDVVYNHFGPDGNYLSSYASTFFDERIHTPWGAAINFQLAPVRRFFIENAIYWLRDYRFDGLRFDAVHSIKNDEFLADMAGEIRETFPDRHIHLILENENNEAALLNTTSDHRKFDAQWTDDWHHCLHVLLTGEEEGYYEDFQNPAAQLARCLSEGFAYQGDPSTHAGGKPRGSPSGHLPPTAFVICLQNHDQIGNRAMGERLSVLAAPQAIPPAVALLLLTPQIPMIFMGDEWGETRPFLFFTDHHDQLADAVREGRRKEFAHFEAFTDPAKRAKIPDPNDRSTFEMSVPNPPEDLAQNRLYEFYHKCLLTRMTKVAPHLPGAKAISATGLGHLGVRAQWQLGNGSVLTVAVNFGGEPLPAETGKGELLVTTGPEAFHEGKLPAFSALVWLDSE